MASTPRLRVFLDSNVIILGLHSPAGPPGRILRLAAQGALTTIVSPYVLEEVLRNINAKFPRALPRLRELLVHSPPEIVSDPPRGTVLPWVQVVHTEDAAILAAAVAAQPDYFVTGDRHFLDIPVLAQESGLRIVSPAQFMELIDAS